MYSGNTYLQDIPDWYRIEKETGRIIRKLTSVKELDYYLKNQDEYIRRLAILRLGELKLKDSITVLKEVMDDHLENPLNKDLAAWVIKSVSIKWNIELFLSGSHLSKFTGKERYTDICKVSFQDFTPAVKFEFSSLLVDSELGLDSGNLRSSEDISFDMDFSFAKWFREYNKDILRGIRKLFIRVPVLLFHLFKIILAAILIKVPVFIFKALKKLLFFPLRLILRHRKLIFASVIILYCLLAFTPQGRIASHRFLGVNLMQVQRRAFQSSREILSYAWSEFKSIAGIEEKGELKTVPEIEPVLNTEDNIKRKYIITAKNGLNLRKQPNASSERVLDKALESNIIVTYLDKSYTDKSGRLWYYVQAPDGSSGWVYSKWLKEIGGDLSAER